MNLPIIAEGYKELIAVPDYAEISELYNFSKKYKKLYIFEDNLEGLYLRNLLAQAGIDAKFFMTASGKTNFFHQLLKKILYKKELFACKHKLDEVGIVVTHNYNLALLKEGGFKNIFMVSEWLSRTITLKLRARPKEEMEIEYNIVEHCNLNCVHCDHFSPISEKKFADPEEFRLSLEKLRELFGEDIKAIKLLGGEPLLHPRLIDFIRYARKYFPKVELIVITNGLLLKNNTSLMEIFHKYDVFLHVTTYPISLDYEAIDSLAKRFGIKYRRYIDIPVKDTSYIKHMMRQPFNLSGTEPDYNFACCYHFNNCLTLKDGKIYTCSIIPFVPILIHILDKILNLEI